MESEEETARRKELERRVRLGVYQWWGDAPLTIQQRVAINEALAPFVDAVVALREEKRG